MYIISIASGQYAEFIPNFLKSINNVYGEVGVELRTIIFSDKNIRINIPKSEVLFLPCEYKPWPFPTLERYKLFLKLEKIIKNDQLIVYSDIDMEFKAPLSLNENKDLFGVIHPGYFNKVKKPFINLSTSSVYIEPKLRKNYLCGGVQGGLAEEFLRASRALSEMIEEDLRLGYIPRWHDESYWNYYYHKFPEKFEILGPEYCWPQEWSSQAHPGKVVAITKSIKLVRKKSMLAAFKTIAGKIKRTLRSYRY